VRQEWSLEELLASWTLVDGDWELVANKTGATRLGFSLLLKFFELEGRFPDLLEEVPQVAVEYVAGLVKVPAADFAKYSLTGRTAEYHRAQVREALGFRPATLEDEEQLTAWLAKEVCPVEMVEDRQREALLVECRARSIEPPGRTRIEKVLVAARNRWEAAFCARAIERLGEVGVSRLLELRTLDQRQQSPTRATSGRAAASDGPDDVKGVAGGRPGDDPDDKHNTAADDGSLNRRREVEQGDTHGCGSAQHHSGNPAQQATVAFWTDVLDDLSVEELTDPAVCVAFGYAYQ
jgi:hypothetical protein